MKRPKTIILLLIIFVYSLINQLIHLIAYAEQPSYHIFSAAGLGLAYFVFSLMSLIMLGITLVCLWEPFPNGFWIIMSGFIFGIITNLLPIIVGLSDPDTLQRSLLRAANARGMIVNPSQLQALTSNWAMTAFLTNVVVLLLIYGLVLWKRNYFFRGQVRY